MKTVIVGGVAAGASTGARLRRLDESAEIILLERGQYVSFANCGLPYHSSRAHRAPSSSAAATSVWNSPRASGHDGCRRPLSSGPTGSCRGSTPR